MYIGPQNDAWATRKTYNAALAYPMVGEDFTVSGGPAQPGTNKVLQLPFFVPPGETWSIDSIFGYFTGVASTAARMGVYSNSGLTLNLVGSDSGSIATTSTGFKAFPVAAVCAGGRDGTFFDVLIGFSGNAQIAASNAGLGFGRTPLTSALRGVPILSSVPVADFASHALIGGIVWDRTYGTLPSSLLQGTDLTSPTKLSRVVPLLWKPQ